VEVKRKEQYQTKHEKIFFNRAKLVSVASNKYESLCDKHFEKIVFSLKDSTGNNFSLSLSTVLDCLYFAINQNHLPRLPSYWIEGADMCRDQYVECCKLL